jgi:hypothetical protein
LAECNYKTVGLSPYHPELNTIMIIWTAVESLVAEKGVTFNMDDVLKFVDKKYFPEFAL